MDGGIFGLLGLIRDHRGALEYDWRTRFGQSLYTIGQSMTITEAARCAAHLERDPSSWTFAAAQGWKYPMSREAMLAAEQFDLAYAKAAGQKATRYPRPWDKDQDQGSDVRRTGNAAGRSREQVAEILNAHGHNLPV